MNHRGGLFSVLTVLPLLGCSLLTAPERAAGDDGDPWCAGELRIGQPCLAETRTPLEVAPGVTYTRIERGERAQGERYIVDVAFTADQSAAEEVASKLTADGYEPRIEPVTRRPHDDPGSEPLGYLVRVGSFAIDAEAYQLRDRLTADGYTGLRVVYSGEDGGPSTGPWVVHVLEVDPQRLEGTIEPALASAIVPERETLTALSKRVGSLAAINGGYFVIEEENGTPGDLAGISVIDGVLVSEALEGRTSLVLPSRSGEGAFVAVLSDTITASFDGGEERAVDGLNREPGEIRSCGGRGGDAPTEQPKHDFTCTDDSELILYTPFFGTSTVPGEGVEVVLDASGEVTDVRTPRGGPIPADGAVLAATGDEVDWLNDHAQMNAKLEIATEVSADGAPLDLAAGTGVINGGPRLLRAGALDITAAAEGFVWPDDPGFYYRFGVRRHPRTLAGITAEGTLILVAVDGRQAGYSAGASFEESAIILQSLGAVEAVNLDGGGSTTVTLGADRVNRTSDATGERPIGDAIVILP